MKHVDFFALGLASFVSGMVFYYINVVASTNFQLFAKIILN